MRYAHAYRYEEMHEGLGLVEHGMMIFLFFHIGGCCVTLSCTRVVIMYKVDFQESDFFLSFI